MTIHGGLVFDTVIALQNSFLEINPIINCLGYVLIFVLGMYIVGSKYPRDHPETIRRRLISVSVSSFIIFLHVSLFIRIRGRSPLQISSYDFEKVFIRQTGLLESSVTSILLTSILYLGVLVDDISSGDMYKLFGFEFWKHRFLSWVGFRNFFIAPVAEELIFRACIMFHLSSLFSSCFMLYFVNSLFFSLAHLHHLIGALKYRQDLLVALRNSLFQVFFTTLFGMYSGFLMLRTGNVLSSIITHSFCNFMGLPDPLGAIERGYQSWGFWGRFIAIGTHLLGVILWLKLIYPWTEFFKYSSDFINSYCEW